MNWNIKRNLTKINYRIHTDAIKENLISKALTGTEKSIIYVSEADVLNMALFGDDSKNVERIIQIKLEI